MVNTLKTRSVPLLFTTLLFFLATSAWAETRIAAVNVNKLMEEAPQVQSASDGMKARFSSREHKLLADRDVIHDLEERYKRDKDVMSSSERENLEQDIRERLRDFKRKSDNFTEDFNLARNEALNRLQDDVNKAIVGVAKEGDYDLVVSESVLYASKRVDITDKVLTRLKALYSGN